MTADPHDDPADFEPQWEAAGEYGLASLVLGAVASLVASLGVVMSLLSHEQAHKWANGPQWVATISGFLGCLGMAALAVAGLVCGRRSVRAARSHRLPTARGWAGLLLSGFGLFGAIGAAGCWAGAVSRM